MTLTVSHLGLDNHRAFSRVTARDAQNRLVWRQRLEHRDRQAVREQMKSWAVGIPVILECTFGWAWMTDELLGAGLEPHLANSAKVAAWRKARGIAKNDKLDADLLSELWLQQPRWWEAWLAPAEVRQRREWMRYRMTLVKTQTGLKNRIHAILHCHGVWHDFADLFGGQGRRFLNSLVGSKEAGLPSSTRLVLRGYLQLLDHVRRQIAGVTQQIRKELTGMAAGSRLRTLPGISWVLGHTILAEVGRFDRFPNGDHLASYSLLAPRDNDSAREPTDEAPIGRRVGHMGRRVLKWAWIEAAHTAIRSSPRFRAIYDRRTNGGKRDRNRGCIAVARELCRIGYVLETRQVDYQEAVSAVMTVQTSKRKSRSVRG
jgi:transposase